MLSLQPSSNGSNIPVRRKIPNPSPFEDHVIPADPEMVRSHWHIPDDILDADSDVPLYSTLAFFLHRIEKGRGRIYAIFTDNGEEKAVYIPNGIAMHEYESMITNKKSTANHQDFYFAAADTSLE